MKAYAYSIGRIAGLSNARAGKEWKSRRRQDKEKGAVLVVLCYTLFFEKIKKGDIPCMQDITLKVLEAASGFEPLNHGFADQCLSRLATPP